MSPARRTPANQTLRGQVQALGGRPPTDAQLRRWVETGAVPAARKRGLGRGRGSTSDYPPGTAEQAVEVMRLLDRGVALRLVPAALFVAGFEVSEELLRSTLIDIVDSAIGGLWGLAVQEPTWPGLWRKPDSALDAADAATLATIRNRRRPVVLRVFHNNMRRAVKEGRSGLAADPSAPKELVSDVVMSLLSAIWVGYQLDQQSTRAIFAAMGNSADIDKETLEVFADQLAELSLIRNRRRLQHADRKQLIQARRSLDAVLQLMGESWGALLFELLGDEGMPILLVICLSPSLLRLGAE